MSELSASARFVIEKRYLRKDPDTGLPAETVEQMFERVALTVSSAHCTGEEQLICAEEYKRAMMLCEFMPNTPTFTGAGTELGQLAACFVLPIDDDIGKDSQCGIFETLSKAVRIQQSGGGVGFSFSRLRPRGDRVQKSAGVSSGPVSFMRAYDAAFETVIPPKINSPYAIFDTAITTGSIEYNCASGPVQYMKAYDHAIGAIQQGGLRRGASLASLRIDHPDIEDFIKCKSSNGELNNFNISVSITDKFMKAVLGGTEYELVNPRTGLVCGIRDANEMMDKIAEAAHKNGEPGVLFIDEINRNNPMPHVYTIETTNPCVTADTIVTTNDGPKPVSDLIGKQFEHKYGKSTSEGFFSTGVQEVFRVTAEHGQYIECTAKHRLMGIMSKWKTVEELVVGFPLMFTDGNSIMTSAPVASVVSVGQKQVYDCTMLNGHPIYISNGFLSHNCGEQALGPWENCCLGSINLSKHLIFHPELLGAEIDWEKLAKTTRTAVRFLDDVITANKYVPSVPQLREAAWRGRRIGLGYMGLADLLYSCLAGYDSFTGRHMAASVTAWIQYNAMLESIELAKSRGPFPAIRGSIYDPAKVTWVPPPLQYESAPLDCPPINWTEVVEGIANFGIRNSALTTIAPTGTIGTIAGVEGYGVEPTFALSYTRNVQNADGTVSQLKYSSPLFAMAMSKYNIGCEAECFKEVMNRGSCRGVKGIPELIEHVFCVATDIKWQDHVAMQATVQKYLSNSVSKTINFPSTATVQEVRAAYINAWAAGCRGITVYVTGSRDGIVLEAGQK